MILRRKLGPKGQIVLPKDVRDFLGVKIGSEIIIEVTESEVKLRGDLKSQEFLTRFYSNPKKLKHKVDINAELDEEYESHSV